ncbi:hypothetical protein RDI58_019858 [Solanum bulbocastanum]|uniref:Uncharacterized protein n=1 Tax=Solanum bulbocastanum TaxID=147425 RepID=A0AAN8TBP3_SOLBU
MFPVQVNKKFNLLM